MDALGATTLDQLSRGRAELLAGRGSFTESFPLFGAALEDYDDLYEEKLDLLLRIDDEVPLTWSGRFRPSLEEATILPRPYCDHLRISVGTGGNPDSSIRAGMVSEQPAEKLDVTMSAIGLIAAKSQDAKDAFYPYWLETMKYGAKARGWAIPSRADYDEMTRGSQAIFTGSANEIAERLISVGQLVDADRYGMQMDWSGVPQDRVMAAIELLGTQILPQVQKAFGV